MDKEFLEPVLIQELSKFIDLIRPSEMIPLTRSKSLLIEDWLSELQKMDPNPERSMHMFVNCMALGAPKHFSSIQKHPLQSPEAVVIQKRLQTLIAGTRQSWTYAIFWKVSSFNADVKKITGCSEITDYLPRVLDWGTGYCEDEEDKLSGTQSSKTEQDQLKRSLHDPYPRKRMNNLQRFFYGLKDVIFFPGSGLPGWALCTSTAIWLSEVQKLAAFDCKHANGARQCGIQTLVCIPLSDGVLELGSSALIFPDSEFDLLDRVRPLFNFRNNICIQEIGTDSAGSSSIPPCIFPGYESESSVGNRPMFQQGDSSSQRDKKTQSNSNSDPDSRYLEVFTQILRRAKR